MSKLGEIDFNLYGDDMQFVEIELDSGDSILAEASSIMYMDDKIDMENICIGGNCKDRKKGLMNKLRGVVSRDVTEKNIFMTVFSNNTDRKTHVAFAASYPGKIIPSKLIDYNGCLICQKDAFLCATKEVAVNIYFQRKIGFGFFGEKSFSMEKLEGDGMIFLHVGGTVIKKKLQVDEIIKIDTSCLVAMSPTVDYDVQFVENIKSELFDGKGLFLGTLKGPGTVWLQSLPFSRMMDKLYSLSAAANKG